MKYKNELHLCKDTLLFLTAQENTTVLKLSLLYQRMAVMRLMHRVLIVHFTVFLCMA